jgi:hypothetical protein
MIIDLIEHSGGTLRGVDYLGVGPRHDGFTCLQVRKPGASRKTHIEVGQVGRIVARGRTLVPSSPDNYEPRANEIRVFLEE